MSKRSRRKKIKSFNSKLFSILVYAFLYIPVIVMIIFSFNDQKANTNWVGFTTEWYIKLFRDTELLKIFGNTLLIAIVSTAISVIIGTIAAVGLSRYNFKGKSIISNALYVPIVIPEIVIGISLLSIFSIVKFPLGTLSVIIGHATLTVPFVIINVKSRLSGYDESIEEASLDLGANRRTTFLNVTLPMIMPGVMSGGGSDYDLVQAGNSQIANLISQGYIDELDFNNIPNIKNLSADALNKDFDPDQKYSVEYLSSYTVVGYNKKTCPIEIKSLGDLLKPELKGTIVSITSSRRIMAIVLDYLGYDPNTTDENQIKEATDFLKKMKSNVKVFDGDSPRKSLLNGECSVALIYNGDLAIAMNEQPDTYEVANIDTGYLKASNEWCVPTGAKHKKEAELFINYMLEADVMAKNLEAYPYNCANIEALKVASDKYKNNKALNLPDNIIKNSVSIKDVGEAEVTYDKYWSEFMSN